MKYLPLIVANLGRRKLRTALTILSVALALFLFASLRTVVTSLDSGFTFGSASRLMVINASSVVYSLPMGYLARLQAIPGVTAVTWSNLFGGRVGPGLEDVVGYAVDAESFIRMYPEMSIPPDQASAFLADRAGAIVGPRLIKQYGWRLGQNVTITHATGFTDLYPGDWTFTIRAVYSTTDPAFGDDVMFFHYAFLDEGTGRQVSPGYFTVGLAEASEAAPVAARIDSMFHNSAYATKTQPEKAFYAGFVTMFGNVRGLMFVIGLAVVFAILLVAGNTMVMAVRERWSEIAVLKTLGFNDGRILLLILGEASLMVFLGAAGGLFGARLLYRLTDPIETGVFAGFDVTSATLVQGALLAAVLALASGIVPAVMAARLSVVQAVRRLH